MTDAPGPEQTGKILPFPVPKRAADQQKPSAVASAGIAEGARRKETAERIGLSLESKKQMDATERFVMARNTRDYIYGLAAAGRLLVRDVGLSVYGAAEVRKLQRYLLPKGIATQEELHARHPSWNPVGKPANYKAVVLAAAKLAGDDENTALLALATGTRFWPGAEDAADDERRAANEVIELLGRIPGRLTATYPLERYFDVIERYQIVPSDPGGDCAFHDNDDFGWFDYLAIPSARLASRRLEPTIIPVEVAFSDVPATGEPGYIDFDAVYAANRRFEASVSRRQVFSLGIGRLAGAIGPVAIFTHEIVLAETNACRVIEQARADRIGPGWHRCTVDLGEGPLEAAWQIKDALINSPEPEDDWDTPPDVRIQSITADWLLAQKEVGWRVADSLGTGVKVWRALARHEYGRIGATDGIPSILEGCLLLDHKTGGPITEIIDSYATLSNALKAWRSKKDANAQKRLGDVAARLADEQQMGHRE